MHPPADEHSPEQLGESTEFHNPDDSNLETDSDAAPTETSDQNVVNDDSGDVKESEVEKDNVNKDENKEEGKDVKKYDGEQQENPPQAELVLPRKPRTSLLGSSVVKRRACAPSNRRRSTLGTGESKDKLLKTLDQTEAALEVSMTEVTHEAVEKKVEVTREELKKLGVGEHHQDNPSPTPEPVIHKEDTHASPLSKHHVTTPGPRMASTVLQAMQQRNNGARPHGMTITMPNMFGQATLRKVAVPEQKVEVHVDESGVKQFDFRSVLKKRQM